MSRHPAFSRSAVGGKKTSDVRARVADSTKFDLQRRCHELGLTESEYIDRLICVSLYGLDAVMGRERERTVKTLGHLAQLWDKPATNN